MSYLLFDIYSVVNFISIDYGSVVLIFQIKNTNKRYDPRIVLTQLRPSGYAESPYFFTDSGNIESGLKDWNPVLLQLMIFRNKSKLF